jgi:hypothetical protein
VVLSNAERQRRFRERRNALATRATLTNASHSREPREVARNALALLLALTQHGRIAARRRLGDDVLTLRLCAESDLPPDLRAALMQWVSFPTRMLWNEGEPINFHIRIEAMSNKRKRKAMERKFMGKADG